MGYGDGGDPHDKLESVIREHLAKTQPPVAKGALDATEVYARIIKHVSAAHDVHIHINVYDSQPPETPQERPRRAVVRPLRARAMARDASRHHEPTHTK